MKTLRQLEAKFWNLVKKIRSTQRCVLGVAFNNTSSATSGGVFLDKVPEHSALHRESL